MTVTSRLSIAPPNRPLFSADGPMLIFLHGTASSFMGSFGDLWCLNKDEREDAAAARWGTARIAAWRAHVKALFGERVYALEHHTLSASPMRNALDLLERLPVDASVHLVSHSRGGLVGELMARALPDPAERRGSEPFTEPERQRFMDVETWADRR